MSVKFKDRHIGIDAADVEKMLQVVGADSIDHLIDETIPASIRTDAHPDIPSVGSEYEFTKALKKLASKNKVFKSYMGLGYYPCITPAVIQRNILENPGWYTAYTPYQAEIAQGRMEALINFQTVVTELTGMELSNASLLDEGTAAAEAMVMMFEARPATKKNSRVFFVDSHVFPQTLAILKTRAVPLGIEIVQGDILEIPVEREELFGALIQYPDAEGAVREIESAIRRAKEHGMLVGVAADLLSLTLLKPPGEMGADVVVGSSQRLGVPMGYGGPHAAFFATREVYKRLIPGRIIGISVDKFGNRAYRMALQTREQHIKRERATSNICTAQVLLAVMAGMYAVYHGPEGLRNIALKIHTLAQMLDQALKKIGIKQENQYYFDTLKVRVSPRDLERVRMKAEHRDINFRYGKDHVFISLDETTGVAEIQEIITVLSKAVYEEDFDIQTVGKPVDVRLPRSITRVSDFLQHETFFRYRKEHEMLRYIKRLESKDLSLVHSMIPLGSCTMKLNATTEMIALSWPEFADIHPFAPENQALGYREMFRQLESWLSEITGLAATSLQPNSGAQGEYAGLMVIRSYFQALGQSHRNVVLIPSSAHGTNPASAVMAGLKIVIVKCDEHGNIDVDDLKSKAEATALNLAALMVTYPSTHGIFEENIREICATIHEYGGQVYMDGANMNAQVGLTSPAMIGADVCHINLHKTFCIPHGGGGPGMGPICVAEHLKPFLPGNPLVTTGGNLTETAISSAPWGSASILTISYAYIAMMGGAGLKRATQIAILSANYIKDRLKGHYNILYLGKRGRAGHEMIVDCREFKKVGIEVEDIAKRLMDYGFHAPTVSFPVSGTLMIEPTESESKEEMDRFVDAMISIKQEITEVWNGAYSRDDNVVKNAPHTLEAIAVENWSHPYSREKAVFPLPYVRVAKFWPSVGRVDNAYGDRNLMCSCASPGSYQEERVSDARQPERFRRQGADAVF